MSFGTIIIEYIDILYIYTLFMIISYAFVYFINNICVGPIRYTKNTSVIILLTELVIIFWAFGIILLNLKHFFTWLPYPLNGLFDFNTKHDELYENCNWIFTVVFFTCAVNVLDRMIFFYNRITSSNMSLMSVRVRPHVN